MGDPASAWGPPQAPMGMMQGPNGQMGGPPMNLGAPMGPNMMQSYQGWGTSPGQQSYAGYGTPSGPGSYQGWGAPLHLKDHRLSGAIIMAGLHNSKVTDRMVKMQVVVQLAGTVGICLKIAVRPVRLVS